MVRLQDIFVFFFHGVSDGGGFSDPFVGVGSLRLRSVYFYEVFLCPVAFESEDLFRGSSVGFRWFGFWIACPALLVFLFFLRSSGAGFGFSAGLLGSACLFGGVVVLVVVVLALVRLLVVLVGLVLIA